VVHNTNDL